ncbi:MAG: hypothetical protein NTY67_09270 [Cyanobacteria bacterium]|nr:hypothetical protein [Cyanobacteriota bacterium]
MLALLLPLALAGCSGTRFGDAMSRSFSGAPLPTADGVPATSSGAVATSTAAAAARSPAAAARSPAAGPKAGSATGQASPAAQATPAGSTRAPAVLTTGSPGLAASPVPRRPAPYRVTILLPQADASAPAEVVTQALRAAGVPFEVETIERIGTGSNPGAPGKAGSMPQTAPTVRPAPALR